MMARSIRNRGAATLAALFTVSSVVGFQIAGIAPAAAQRSPVAGGRAPDPRKLLMKMLKSERERVIAGREISFIAGGRQSEQQVKLHPQRGMRLEFLRPPGDLLVDNNRRSWRLFARDKRLVERESLVMEMRRTARDVAQRLQRKDLEAEWVGQDVVAGRDTDIVQVSPPGGTPAPSRRFWIDKETGLRLKTEDRGPLGRVISSSYFLSVDLNPVFTDADFRQPPVPPGVKVERDNRKVFRSLEEARRRLSFPLRQPGYLPPGFTLREVVGTKFRGKNVVVQRYGNGLNVLSLVQTDAPLPDLRRGLAGGRGPLAPQTPTGARGPRIHSWRDGKFAFTLISGLTQDEMQRIADSVK